MSVLQATLHTFEQIATQIHALTPAQYTEKLTVLSGAALGQHFRHIIEFYECLFSQLQTGSINYDERKRNLQIETVPAYALARVQTLQEQVQKVDIQTPITLISTFSSDPSEVPTHIQSSVERELVYNIEHAIHHLAIVKIGIKHYYPQTSVVENLGVAPATVKHRLTTNEAVANH